MCRGVLRKHQVVCWGVLFKNGGLLCGHRSVLQGVLFISCRARVSKGLWVAGIRIDRFSGMVVWEGFRSLVYRTSPPTKVRSGDGSVWGSLCVGECDRRAGTSRWGVNASTTEILYVYI